jgi:hypothetical protein
MLTRLFIVGACFASIIKALLAKSSRMLLIATDMSVEDLENIMTLDFTLHKHLPTNSYHVKVFKDLLNASGKVSKESNIEEFSSQFTINIKNLFSVSLSRT